MVDVIASDRDHINDVPTQWYLKKWEAVKRLAQSNAHPFKKLDKMIEVIDEAANRTYKGETCKRGCSHCCYVGVGLSGVEAKYIEHKTGRKIVNYSEGKTDKKETRPCSFLENDECSIYEHRPIVCRVFRSFDDPKICENPSNTHALLTINQPDQGGFEFANHLYFKTIFTIIKRHPEYRVINDIRGFFDERN